MKDKITNLKDLEFYNNFELLASLVNNKRSEKPSKVLDDMAKALSEIFFYVNNLQTDRWAYEKSMSDYRLDKNRAVERARKAEEKLDDALAKLKKFNNFAE